VWIYNIAERSALTPIGHGCYYSDMYDPIATPAARAAAAQEGAASGMRPMPVSPRSAGDALEEALAGVRACPSSKF